jgi:6-phosphofructo-2-kinase/fructose-2,6-biphosphatase 4
MSAIESDEESEIFNGFGSQPISRNPSLNSRTRWSFHNHTKPNLVNLVAATRRLSDINGEDGVHKSMDIMNPMAPQLIGGGQLYSTESGRLFHAGKICIVLAGLPGRGKTHLSVSLTRYLRWLGVKTHSFHLGNYRRANAEENLNHDLFIPSPDTKKANEFRTKIVDECLNDVIGFFQKEGQVAIYDAVNALPEYRAELYEKFKALNIQVLFIESLVTDDTIIMKNMEEAARSSPDYKNWDYKKAYNDYCERINFLTPYYQEMGENDKDLSYIKFINFGERIELHNSNYGYLINKVVFFLMNSRIKSGSVFFARCYKNSLDYSYDPPLDETGLEYAKNLTNTLISHLKSQGKNYIKDIQLEKRPDPPKRELSIDERQPAAGVDGIDDDSLVIWTSVKQRTIETTQFFAIRNIKIRHRIQLSQKNPGVVGTMSDEEILKTYPEEWKHFVKDLYHYRFSRAESYHDLAIKIEPLILEMERMSGDILIIADESILKVLYGYLMSCSCYDIPGLQFLTDEILEIKYNAYENTAEVIPIQGDNE